ncbi:hypothetical protein PR202_gb07781 [Eleusine coracana subsp. coracana]|uniref:BTB domain-containing protein n=1 Tax=Eleusine coracana subsp. coracana TaxID=191504 RepID=A0AAV5ED51_ELECO|nr:hypothetical protein PR202_gb07781 [Eleusine coracana subsp. coracana]
MMTSSDAIDSYCGFPLFHRLHSQLSLSLPLSLSLFINLKDRSSYVSLVLNLKDRIPDNAIIVRFNFSFIDQVDLQKPSHIGTKPACKFFTDKQNSWGMYQFIKLEDLEQQHLKDDCFMVWCDIIILGVARVADIAVPAPPAAAFMPPPPDWPQHFRALLQGADVRFLIKTKTFAVHWCVLAARSLMFSAELYSTMKEGAANTAIMEIDDMRADMFSNLLHFIYTDSLLLETTSTTELGKHDEAASSTVQHLLMAVDRYGMERLKLICEDKLCRHISLNTVGTTLVLAEQHHCKKLKHACFKFIKTQKKLDVVVATDGFQHLAKSCPFALFELIAKLGEDN